MSFIKEILSFEVLDSRGTPTLKTKVILENGIFGEAMVPSGASTGKYEALELRDGDHRYKGKGVLKALKNVEGPIKKFLLGKSVLDQREIDLGLIALDGTPSKSHLGANALLSVSLACARAAANNHHIPLYQHIGGVFGTLLPTPMMNVVNGGAHADNSLDIQEFMIIPKAGKTFAEKVRIGAEVFYALKTILKKRGDVTAVGDEGGFAPSLSSAEEAIELILEAITQAGFQPEKEVSLALDLAASEFYDADLQKYIEKKKKNKNQKYKEYSPLEWAEKMEHLIKAYPIESLEDPFAEEDWETWEYFSHRSKDKVQIVGDDIFVTNPLFLKKGIQRGVANAILIKLNQIGTLTETLDTIEMAKEAGYKTIISHRSGETEDSFIADLAVGTNAGQIKTGSLSRSDRVAKYNRLIEIEKELNL